MPRARKAASRSFHKTVYTIVEGEKTEADYVDFIRKNLPGKHGVQIIVEDPGSARKTLFAKARQVIADEDEDTEVWIICDVDDDGDELSKLRKTTFKNSHRLKWAISNPAFALWLVMHFESCTKWEGREVFARSAKQHGVATGKNGKGIDENLLRGKAEYARKNAEAARRGHASAQTDFPHNNPQSDVDKFVARIIDLYNEHVPDGHETLAFASVY